MAPRLPTHDREPAAPLTTQIGASLWVGEHGRSVPALLSAGSVIGGAREVEELEELSRNDNGGRDGLDPPPGRTRGPRSVQGRREGRATGGAEIASPRSSGDPYDGCPGAPASLPSRGP